jgi:hypothetical protein
VIANINLQTEAIAFTSTTTNKRSPINSLFGKATEANTES